MGRTCRPFRLLPVTNATFPSKRTDLSLQLPAPGPRFRSTYPRRSPPELALWRFGVLRSPGIDQTSRTRRDRAMKAVSPNAVSTPEEWTSDDGGFHRLTGYFGDVRQLLDGPQGYLIEHFPGPGGGEGTAIVSHPHYHRVRQFQLVVHGDRPTIGKRSLEPIAFHYTDPSTPYGPISAGKGGVGYFTLRARRTWRLVQDARREGADDVSPRRNIAVQVGAPTGRYAQVETADRAARGRSRRPTTSASHRGSSATRRRRRRRRPVPRRVKGSAASSGRISPSGRSLGRSSGDAPPQLRRRPEGAEVIVLQFPVPQLGSEIVDPNAPGQA